MKVLVWGTAEQGPCAYFRGHLFDDELAKLGVEMRHIGKVNFKKAAGWEDRDDLEAFKAGKVEVDLSDFEWADVVMYRRYYNTSIRCNLAGTLNDMGCGFRTHDPDEAGVHPHPVRLQDEITRHMWPIVREAWTGGILYETDDNHWKIKPWNGYYGDVILEHDLIRDMAQRADLVTVSTPALVPDYGRFNKRIRVIRNAIDCSLYEKDAPQPEGDLPRLVYYGSTARLRDYGGRHITGRKDDGEGYAFQAVQANRNLLRRVFLGTDKGTENVISAFFDEQTPYITGIAAFSKALANSHGDIGIAPLSGDDFDMCKSELHFLEYAMSDMAFIGQRFSGGGPYSVVRDGVDGLLARGSQEWFDAVRKLAKSKDLREQLAGAAKERVIREYSHVVRAQEWADAFRWTAENAGIGKRKELIAA